MVVTTSELSVPNPGLDSPDVDTPEPPLDPVGHAAPLGMWAESFADDQSGRATGVVIRSDITVSGNLGAVQRRRRRTE